MDKLEQLLAHRPRQTPLRVLWRFLVGRPLDGRPRTDSRFLKRGSRALTQTGYASKWAMLAGWQRAAWRLGTLTTLAGAAYGAWVAPFLTGASALTTASGASTYGTWRLGCWLRTWRHRTRIVEPLEEALGNLLGLPTETAREVAGLTVKVPVHYGIGDDVVVRIALPRDFSGAGGVKKEVTELVGRKLGRDWDAHWTDVGRPMVSFTPAPKPPGKVTFEDLRAEFERGPASAPILGVGTRGELLRVDLDAESPHVVLSMGTGGGKSATLRLIIAFLIRHGVERIDICDPKRISLNAFKDIPGVFIHRDEEAWIAAIEGFRAEMESRYRVLEDNEEFKFPRRVLIIEEMNSFTEMLRVHWDSVRAKSDPKDPPVLRDLSFILFQGRQARMNVVAVLQQANARAMGGSAMRDQFGTKILARFSPQVWKMLVDISPRPKSSRHRGRAVVVLGDEHQTVQLGFITPEEATAYARSFRPDGWIAETLTVSHPVVHMGDDGVSLTAAEPIVVEPQRYTIAEASRLGILPMKHDALRKARSDDAEFPAGKLEGRDRMYTAEELIRWYNNRSRTTARIPEHNGAGDRPGSSS